MPSPRLTRRDFLRGVTIASTVYRAHRRHPRRVAQPSAHRHAARSNTYGRRRMPDFLLITGDPIMDALETRNEFALGRWEVFKTSSIDPCRPPRWMW